MSSYANFIIEVKEDGEWKTWSALKRYVEHTYTTCKDGKLEQVTNTPDYDNKELGKLDDVKFIWKQGSVRDLFSITYMGESIKHSGLPSDVTDDSKQVIDKNMAYKTSTTYTYLSELQEYADSKIEELFKNLAEDYEKEYFYNAIVRQLNTISNDLFDKQVISVKPENDEFNISEDIQYITKEWIYDIISIQSFCQEVRTLVKEIGNADVFDGDIRLICWID